MKHYIDIGSLGLLPLESRVSNPGPGRRVRRRGPGIPGKGNGYPERKPATPKRQGQNIGGENGSTVLHYIDPFPGSRPWTTAKGRPSTEETGGPVENRGLPHGHRGPLGKAFPEDRRRPEVTGGSPESELERLTDEADQIRKLAIAATLAAIFATVVLVVVTIEHMKERNGYHVRRETRYLSGADRRDR